MHNFLFLFLFGCKTTCHLIQESKLIHALFSLQIFNSSFAQRLVICQLYNLEIQNLFHDSMEIFFQDVRDVQLVD